MNSAETGSACGGRTRLFRGRQTAHGAALQHAHGNEFVERTAVEERLFESFPQKPAEPVEIVRNRRRRRSQERTALQPVVADHGDVVGNAKSVIRQRRIRARHTTVAEDDRRGEIRAVPRKIFRKNLKTVVDAGLPGAAVALQQFRLRPQHLGAAEKSAEPRKYVSGRRFRVDRQNPAVTVPDQIVGGQHPSRIVVAGNRGNLPFGRIAVKQNHRNGQFRQLPHLHGAQRRGALQNQHGVIRLRIHIVKQKIVVGEEPFLQAAQPRLLQTPDEACPDLSELAGKIHPQQQHIPHRGTAVDVREIPHMGNPVQQLLLKHPLQRAVHHTPVGLKPGNDFADGIKPAAAGNMIQLPGEPRIQILDLQIQIHPSAPFACIKKLYQCAHPQTSSVHKKIGFFLPSPISAREHGRFFSGKRTRARRRKTPS